jgi:hypothetical protein
VAISKEKSWEEQDKMSGKVLGTGILLVRDRDQATCSFPFSITWVVIHMEASSIWHSNFHALQYMESGHLQIWVVFVIICTIVKMHFQVIIAPLVGKDRLMLYVIPISRFLCMDEMGQHLMERNPLFMCDLIGIKLAKELGTAAGIKGRISGKSMQGIPSNLWVGLNFLEIVLRRLRERSPTESIEIKRSDNCPPKIITENQSSTFTSNVQEPSKTKCEKVCIYSNWTYL